MFHDLSQIAENYRFQESSFVKFAEQNAVRFHLDMSISDKPTVSSWHVDDLIDLFKASCPKFRFLSNSNFEVYAENFSSAEQVAIAFCVRNRLPNPVCVHSWAEVETQSCDENKTDVKCQHCGIFGEKENNSGIVFYPAT